MAEANQKIYFQSLTQEDLATCLLPLSRPKLPRDFDPALASPEFLSALEVKKQKLARMRAKQIFHWVYQRFVTDWDQMSDIAKEVREWLKAHVEIFRLSEFHSKQSLDGTKKFLWSLGDRKTIESVIIPAALSERSLPVEGQSFRGAPKEEDLTSDQWKRLTVCISSQVGCAMACKFCLTGIQGLDRNLGVHEIVTQVWELRRQAPITNIVFMGMGEPLHNVDNVIQACKIILDQDGMGFSKRKVTVSTSGIVPAIEKLKNEVDVSLAISLNATTDAIRSEIMPVNKKWNIAALLKECRKYSTGPHRRVTFEYVMLKDINDSIEDAERLYRLVKDFPSKINLIPFNEHPGSPYQRPSDEKVFAFHRYLGSRNITVTVRISRGQDILAACGQLRSVFGTARGTDRHKDWDLRGGEVSAPLSTSIESVKLSSGDSKRLDHNQAR